MPRSSDSDDGASVDGSSDLREGGTRRAGEPQPDTVLSVRGLNKYYGATRALQEIDLDIAAETVHGLVGKNGAGKSTLVKIIAGLEGPNVGTVAFQGTDITGEPVGARRERGIRLLTQSSEIMPDLSVAENLLVDQLPTKWRMVDWSAGHRIAAEALGEFGLDLDTHRLARDLTLLERRKMGIAQTLFGGGVLAILDEPTEGLSRSERQQLFDFVRELASQGKTFVFISHYDNEVRQLCSEATVLRDGRIVHRVHDMGAVSSADMSRWITGSDVDVATREREHLATGESATDESATPELEARGLVGTGFGPVDLVVRRGEIVGLAGLTGSGAQEVARALSGHDPAEDGSVKVAGKDVRIRAPEDAFKHDIGYLTHDRIGEGVVAPLSIRENVVLGRWPVKGLFIDRGAEARLYDTYRDRLSLVASGPEQEIGQLSGGNQQKALIARLLASGPRVLVLDQPTVGVDVGVREEVHRMVDHLAAERGMAVILLSSDPDEITRLADRVLIFHEGVVAEELTGQSIGTASVLEALEADRKREETG